MISVCIATYNGEKYIREQISSILLQIGDNDEVIVSDDSSTDKTIEIIESFHDNRIQIFQNNTFHSPIFNFENALKKSKGDYIFLSDQDDVWYDDKVRITLEYLKKYELVISNFSIIDADDCVIKQQYFPKDYCPLGIIKNLLKNNYTGAVMAFRRNILEYALPFPSKIPMHDQWLGFIAEKKHSVGYIEKPLIKYRRHANNVSNTGGKSVFNIMQKLMFRLNLIRELRNL